MMKSVHLPVRFKQYSKTSSYLSVREPENILQQAHFATNNLPCPRPFEWCEVHPDGSIFLCCPSWLRRPIGNILEQPVEEAWNSPVAVEVRKSVLNGSYHNCRRQQCPRLSNSHSGAVSVALPTSEALIKEARPRLSRLPVRLNLCFDISCNLACPSCRTKHQISTGETRRQAERISARVVKELLPHALELTLSGYGDPFGSPVYFNLLQQANALSAPSLESLRLHTNALLFTEERWSKLPALQRILTSVEVSVDAGCAQTYRQNRGGDFKQLVANLEFISGLDASLRLSMVVQQNNYQEVPALYQLAKQLGAELYLSQLVNWGTYSREEFIGRDVCNAQHPEHSQFRTLLGEMVQLPGVDLGNLSQLASS